MHGAQGEPSVALSATNANVRGSGDSHLHEGQRRENATPVSVVKGIFERETLVPTVLGRADRVGPSAIDPTANFATEQLARALLARAAERALDIISVFVLTAVLSPFIIPLVIVMAFSRGPVIYAHRRIGKDGKMFRCFKFRTMVPDADRVLYDLLERDPKLKAEWLRDRKLRRDPRVTRVGHLLRRTSLDELPQLWNVLRGEMTMVGPRPIVKEELLRYGRNAPVYLSVKPGVTGLWQVSGRNNTDYRRRVAIDVYYVRNQSALLDLYILLKTVRVVLRRDGAY